MAQGLYTTTQELLTLWQLTLALTTPLPNSAWNAQPLPNKLTRDDDIEAFLGNFEHVTSNAIAPS